MATSTPGILSFISVLLAVLVIFIPLILGDSSNFIFFFLLSFGLLIISFVLASVGIESEENFGLANFSLILSIVFLLFYIIGALAA